MSTRVNCIYEECEQQLMIFLLKNFHNEAFMSLYHDWSIIFLFLPNVCQQYTGQCYVCPQKELRY
jgi:hypothetical protein